MNNNDNARVNNNDIELARLELERVTGEPVTVQAGGGGGAFAWSVAPAFGRSFGHLGRSKRAAFIELHVIIAEQNGSN